MFLQELHILNFKNFPMADLALDEKVNCLVGDNGAGKTNLLDAIFYLAFSKSFFNPSDSQNILEGQPFFSIQGVFEGEKKEKVSCSLKKGQKKVMSRNAKNYERFADHIGLIPLVMISPIDILLIIEGSEGRRKWLDSLISQFDRKYLDHLIAYNKALFQRNSLLKQIRQNGGELSLLELWNDPLVEHGTFLFDRRQEIMQDLVKYFNDYYEYISGKRELVDIAYHSHLQSGEGFLQQLESTVEKDLRLQYTSVGLHKDDVEFLINGRPVKKFASQGQQKTVLLSLRLAQAKLIADRKNTRPLMLLDDIYDKLDAFRMSKLLEVLNTDDFGQLFITDTNQEHMQDLLAQCDMKGKFFEVNSGEIKTSKTNLEILN